MPISQIGETEAAGSELWPGFRISVFSSLGPWSGSCLGHHKPHTLGAVFDYIGLGVHV